MYQAFYPLSYLCSFFLFFNSIAPMRFIWSYVQLWTEHKLKLHWIAVNLRYFWKVATISNQRTLISMPFLYLHICIDNQSGPEFRALKWANLITLKNTAEKNSLMWWKKYLIFPLSDFIVPAYRVEKNILIISQTMF